MRQDPTPATPSHADELDRRIVEALRPADPTSRELDEGWRSIKMRLASPRLPLRHRLASAASERVTFPRIAAVGACAFAATVAVASLPGANDPGGVLGRPSLPEASAAEILQTAAANGMSSVLVPGPGEYLYVRTATMDAEPASSPVLGYATDGDGSRDTLEAWRGSDSSVRLLRVRSSSTYWTPALCVDVPPPDDPSIPDGTGSYVSKPDVVIAAGAAIPACLRVQSLGVRGPVLDVPGADASDDDRELERSNPATTWVRVTPPAAAYRIDATSEEARAAQGQLASLASTPDEMLEQLRAQFDDVQRSEDAVPSEVAVRDLAVLMRLSSLLTSSPLDAGQRRAAFELLATAPEWAASRSGESPIRMSNRGESVSAGGTRGLVIRIELDLPAEAIDRYSTTRFAVDLLIDMDRGLVLERREYDDGLGGNYGVTTLEEREVVSDRTSRNPACADGVTCDARARPFDEAELAL